MNKAILTVAAALSVCSMASAQHFDPEHRHSIEISAGMAELNVSSAATGLLIGCGWRF